MTKTYSQYLLEPAIAHNPIIVNADFSLYEVVQMMNQAQHQASVPSEIDLKRAESSRSYASCVLVVAESQLVGIVTPKDLLQFIGMDLDLSEVKVADVMKHPVVSMPMETFQDGMTALNLLRKHRISYLPLLDEHNYPIAVVTLKALLQVDELVLRSSEQEQTQKIEYDSLLAAIAGRIQSSLDLQTILDCSVTEIRQFLQTDRVIAYRFEPDWSGIVVAESVTHGCNSLLGKVLVDPHFGEAMVEPYKNGRIQVTDNIYVGLTDCHTKFLEQLQVQAIVVVPILQGTQLWGLLAAQECSQSRFWDRSSVTLLQQLSTHISIAIQQAGTISELQQLNQELETKILERTIALETSETRLNLIVSNVSDGILIVDQEGKIVFANPSAARTFKIKVEQLTGQIIGIPIVINNRFEIDLLTCDGKIEGSEMQVELIKWENQPAYLISLHDITERQKAEIKLLKSQSDLADAQQIAHVGSWEMELATQRLSWSDELYRLFGLDPSQPEPSFEQLREYMNHPDWEVLTGLIERAIKFGEPYAVDLQIVRADGSVGYIFTKGNPKRDLEGEISHLFGIAMDISDRKAYESKLRRYERVVAATTDALILYDRNYSYQLVNQVYLGWHNKQQEQIIGHSIEGIIGENSFQDDIQPRLARSLAGEVQRYEAWFDYQDGYRRFVRVTYSPYIEIDGSISGVLASLHDLTELKQIEESLRKSEEQLQLANEELVRATRLKDEFLANMSHELRTPLNSILGMTEGLQEGVFGVVNEKQIKALQTVERSGNHLLSLINDILDLAKIESGLVELDYSPTDIASLCKSSLAFIKQQAHKKSIQLDIKLPENLPDLSMDERRIRQVLINLLNNAVKFTLEGGRITLKVSKQEIQEIENISAWICFAVIDTGIGIAPENIKKLFQPFIQIDSALNRQYEGTGLGLALVKQMVELHGGRVSLTSELGLGSCFTIELPYIPVSLEIVTGLQPVSISDLELPSTRETTQRPLILIVEDNEANIGTFSSYLEAKGYRILLARDGQEAIALAKAHHPDLILMDIQMPVMDGLEATRQIRLDPNLVDIPIIALTALAMTGDREKCLAAGADEYLTKPIKLKALSLSIQKLLI